MCLIHVRAGDQQLADLFGGAERFRVGGASDSEATENE